MGTWGFPEPDTLSPNITGGLPWEKKFINMLGGVPNVKRTR